MHHFVIFARLSVVIFLHQPRLEAGGWLTVPFGIFMQGRVLVAYGLLFLTTIGYMWWRFVRYVMTSAAGRVREAAESSAPESGLATGDATAADPAGTSAGNPGVPAAEANPGVPAAEADASPFTLNSSLDEKMAAWMKGGGHLQHNLKSEVVAQQAGVPKSHLLRWVKAQGYESFSVWINTQRFHSVFKQYSGLTPAQNLKRLRRTGSGAKG